MYFFSDSSIKNENVVLFMHPHVVPNLYEFLSYAELKRRILVIKQLMVPADFHSISFLTMGTNNCLVLQNIFLFVQHKKETYTGLERHEVTKR